MSTVKFNFEIDVDLVPDLLNFLRIQSSQSFALLSDFKKCGNALPSSLVDKQLAFSSNIACLANELELQFAYFICLIAKNEL